MGRPLSPSQIPQKNISMPSKPQNNFCRLAADIRQPEKQTIVFKKQVGKNIKDKKGDKGGGEGAPSQEGKPILGREFLEERFPNTRKHSPCRVCGEPWKNRGQHNRKEK